MGLAGAFLEVGQGRTEESFALFAQTLDPQWIEQALQATGTGRVRRRTLPAEYVVWLVIGMGLLRDRSLEEVVRHLDLVLPDVAAPAHPTVTGGAIVQARDRLGDQPLETLFTLTAGLWAPASADQYRWRGLAVYGVDGSTLRVPDNPENDEAFGRPPSGRGQAGYPQVRVVALMALRSHLLAGLALGPTDTGEVTPGRVPLAPAAGAFPDHRRPGLSVLSRLPPDSGGGPQSPLAHPGPEEPHVGGSATPRAP